jgi:hypothetical protein
MSTSAKLAAFAATLAVLFGGGALAGGAINPNRDEPRATHADASPSNDGAHGAAEKEPEHKSTSHSESKTKTHGGSGASHPVRGLAVAENGLRVVVEDPELRRGRSERLRFRIVNDSGRTVRGFDVEHEKRMHLIVARRDLASFQHLHPEQQADGSWTTDLRLDDAGSYRLFADFAQARSPTRWPQSCASMATLTCVRFRRQLRRP